MEGAKWGKSKCDFNYKVDLDPAISLMKFRELKATTRKEFIVLGTEKKNHNSSDVTDLVFQYLLVIVALQFSLANGSHIIGNTISPLLNVYRLYGWDEHGCYVNGSIMVTLGLIILGYKILETIGKNVIVVDFQKGFAA